MKSKGPDILGDAYIVLRFSNPLRFLPRKFILSKDLKFFLGEPSGLLYRPTVYLKFVSSVVEWLERRARDQHCLGSKPTRAILLCPWERHFTAHSPACWS